MKTLTAIVLLCISSVTYSHDDVSFYGKYIGINKEKETCEITISKEVRSGFLYPVVLLNQKENQSFPENFAYLDAAAVSTNNESFKSVMKVFLNQHDQLDLIKFSISRNSELQRVSAVRKIKAIFSVFYRQVSSFECEQLKKIN